MKKYLYLPVLLIVVTFLSSVFTTNTKALTIEEQKEQIQKNREDLQKQIEENKENRQEIREENIETRCDIATTRIESITTKYEEGRLKYVNRYNKLTEKLENLLIKLNEKEIDPQDLPSQIESLKTMTAEFNTLIDSAIAKANESKTLACGESDGAYREKLNEAKSIVLEARIKALDINNYFLTTIVDELNSIKDNNI